MLATAEQLGAGLEASGEKGGKKMGSWSKGDGLVMHQCIFAIIDRREKSS